MTVWKLEFKQQDRTEGLRCSGQLPYLSGTIKIFRRPVQKHAIEQHDSSPVKHHCVQTTYTHNTLFVLTELCQEAPSIWQTNGWQCTSCWLASDILKHFSLSCGPVSLDNTSVWSPVTCALSRPLCTHVQTRVKIMCVKERVYFIMT